MDSSRYERIRELFLAAEELLPGDQEAFLRQQANGDADLFAEVASLLAEHDPAAAQAEGECAHPIAPTSAITPATLSGSDALTSDRLSDFPSKLHETLSGRGAAELPKAQSESPDPAKIETEQSSGQITSPASDSQKTHASTGSRSKSGRALITQQGALRTHASPRYHDTPQPKQPSAAMAIWAERTRKSRRRNSGWLWLAALLPTAIIGGWTYSRVVKTMESSVVMNLEGAVQNISLATDRYLTDQALMAESWARQPSLRSTVESLVGIGCDRSAS